MSGKHPSHKTRMSDASSYDEICVRCHATDHCCGGWGQLAYPCPNPETPATKSHEVAMKAACHLEDDPCPLEQRDADHR